MIIRTVAFLKRSIVNRPTFFSAAIFGIMMATISSIVTSWQWSSLILLGWNSTIWMYLIRACKKLWAAQHLDIQRDAQQQDEGKWVILLIVLLSLIMSMVAIIAGLSDLAPHSWQKMGHIALTILTIISSWLMIHTIFAIHYAHDFYLKYLKQQQGGLDFPNTQQPTYPDFLYFSFIIGTSAQTADVSITSRSMRLLNIFHCILAFFFNTSILAIMINIIAGLL